MKPSQVYRKAAIGLRVNEWGCCDLINYEVNGDPMWGCDETKEFASLFSPYDEPADDCDYWGEQWSDNRREKEIYNCRSLALLLMSEIAKDEERSK